MPQSSSDETVLFVNPKNQAAAAVRPPASIPNSVPTPEPQETPPDFPEPPLTVQSSVSPVSPLTQNSASPSIHETMSTESQPPVLTAPIVEAADPNQISTASPSPDASDTSSAQYTHVVEPAETTSEKTSSQTTTQTLHQPVALLIVRLVFVGLFYYFVLWLLQSVLGFMAINFPELVPNFVPPSFFGSKIFLWGTILYLFIAIGIALRWWSIFFEISPSEVVVHSGIIIKQAQVLKRVGISIRQIEFKRTLLGMLLKYVTIEIGSEVLGGVSLTISDNQASLDTITSALQPGETKQTKKIF